MVTEKDFHTEEAEFSTSPPNILPGWKSNRIRKIDRLLIGTVPNWLNLASFPLRSIYFRFPHFWDVAFKKDKKFNNDLKIYYSYAGGEWVAYSENVFLKTSYGRQPIVVSPGVYINATTDHYFIHKYDAKVIGVDPTPIVTKYIDYCYKIGYFKKDQYILEPSALSSKVGSAEFSFDESGMGSIGTKKETKVKVKTVNLNYIIEKYKLPAIDLLQIDIEGGEYDVIEHFEDIKVPIPQICIEFHQFSYNSIVNYLDNKIMKDALQKLRSMGYHLVNSFEPWDRVHSLFEVLLIHQDYLK